jgi:hypothetical protein
MPTTAPPRAAIDKPNLSHMDARPDAMRIDLVDHQPPVI